MSSSYTYSNPAYPGPWTIPSKGNNYPSSYTSYGYSLSPPECDDAASSSAAPSYGYGGHHSHSHHHHGRSSGASAYSATSAGSYIGSSSSSEYDDYVSSGTSAAGVDFQEYMQDRFAGSFNPVPLDRGLAVQAQTSGKMNAKQRELMDLQKQAQARLARTRERFADGMRDARDVRSDLEWTQKKMTSLQSKAARKHPHEYQKARARYPSPQYD